MKKLFKLSFLIIPIFLSVTAFGQGIKGKVIDADIKEGIVGATVTIENTPYTTSTDLQGNFSIKLPKGDYKMSVSFSGYEKKIISVIVPATTIITLPDVSLEEAIATAQDEVLVVVGSRATEGRGKNETTAPIDVVTSEQLQAFGQMDLNQILHFLVPAFNSNRQSGSDISDHVDPTSLRGLGPDQTLVLINGKRFHQSALIGTFGSRGKGNTGTDLNTIPVAAIDHIEILRDGAAAQYGSDAIAGVINLVLKSTTKELTGSLNAGVYAAGDGIIFNPNLNYGLKIGENGFLNITAEVLSKEKTFRKADAQYLDYKGQNGRTLFGDASYINSSFYLNSVVALSEKTKFYSSGGINFRSTDAQGFTVDTLNPRNVKSVFPNGYEPRIGSDIFDGSLTIGLKTKTNNGWEIDLYNTYGKNSLKLSTLNTVNPSQVLSTNIKNQINFDAGGYNLSQNTTGLTFTKSLENVLSGVNISLGSEFRTDAYGVVAGEEASWKRYGNDIEVAGGAQNFPGIRPDNALTASRTNFGVYGDAEVNVTNSWLIATALRYENYSDFGGTLNGKIASRIKVADALSFRGSFSSGFRAPSLAQVYFGTVINDVVVDEITKKPTYVERLIANNQSSITKALGVPSLKQETSLNASLGFVIQPSKDFSVSVDGYAVNVKNRIVLTGEFSASDQGLEGIFNNLGVVAAQFFANAIDTKTYGVDVVTNYTTTIGLGTLTSSLAFNYNHLDIDKVVTTGALAGREEQFLDRRERSLITYAAPKYKFHALLDYKLNRFSSSVRVSGFSSMELVDYNSANVLPNMYGAKMTTDLSAGYSLTENIKFVLNGSNIFNVYPDKQNPGNTETGGMYEAIQMGFGGSFYSARLKFKF
ncbi:TonB-dependent receptor [Arcicella sp. LKC2W]|uniref:TonB-dependent receptor n=1 Tax=Arcicella sp. LKC2W TaxID=2984198 RepID=UPI002B206124|nr:TonB-dependent receptor [Arcicella sp. LKC2W]MEA5458829.1 TonB-dependent receptor [Arcicella sp. LKC2W]